MHRLHNLISIIIAVNILTCTESPENRRKMKGKSNNNNDNMEEKNKCAKNSDSCVAFQMLQEWFQ